MSVEAGAKMLTERTQGQRLGFPKYGFIGLGVLLLGFLTVLSFNTTFRVDKVRIRYRQNIGGQVDGGLAGILPNPNLWVEVWSGGNVLRSPIMYSAVIGNGFTFDLPGTIPITKIDVIKVWQKHGAVELWRSVEIDQVEHPHLTCAGGTFHFHLLGTYGGSRWPRKVGFVSEAIGAALLLIAGISFLRRHAVRNTMMALALSASAVGCCWRG